MIATRWVIVGKVRVIFGRVCNMYSDDDDDTELDLMGFGVATETEFGQSLFRLRH
jgi:hypothetical protein